MVEIKRGRQQTEEKTKTKYFHFADGSKFLARVCQLTDSPLKFVNQQQGLCLAL